MWDTFCDPLQLSGRVIVASFQCATQLSFHVFIFLVLELDDGFFQSLKKFNCKKNVYKRKLRLDLP